MNIVGLPAKNCKRTDNVWGYEGSVFGGIIEVGESLVLMEDALRGVQKTSFKTETWCLNPCSNGRCSQRKAKNGKEYPGIVS